MLEMLKGITYYTPSIQKCQRFQTNYANTFI